MQVSRRRLPHRYAVGEPLFVTIRLHGSLPPGREFRGGRMDSGKAFVCMDRLLDEYRAGPAYLRLPAIAHVLADQIREGADRDYELHAWVVMPNHAHLLITPKADVPNLLRRLKGASAREANKLLGLTGQPFWQDESYEHLVRNADEFNRIENYILQNPVRARLGAISRGIPLVQCLEKRRAEARPTFHNTVVLGASEFSGLSRPVRGEFQSPFCMPH